MLSGSTLNINLLKEPLWWMTSCSPNEFPYGGFDGFWFTIWAGFWTKKITININEYNFLICIYFMRQLQKAQINVLFLPFFLLGRNFFKNCWLPLLVSSYLVCKLYSVVVPWFLAHCRSTVPLVKLCRFRFQPDWKLHFCVYWKALKILYRRFKCFLNFTYGVIPVCFLIVSATFCSLYKFIGELNCLWTS